MPDGLRGEGGLAFVCAVAFVSFYLTWADGFWWVINARHKWSIGHPITHPEKSDFRDGEQDSRNEYISWTRGFYNIVEWAPLYFGSQGFLICVRDYRGISLIASAMWLVGRVVYTGGYARGGAMGRLGGLGIFILGAIAPGMGNMWLSIARFLLRV
jgi:hypothetical protein